MAKQEDWADKRVANAIRTVCNQHRNSDLRADNGDIRTALAEAMRQLVRDCAFIVTETDIEWGPRVYHREEDASATLTSAARRLKAVFPDSPAPTTPTTPGAEVARGHRKLVVIGCCAQCPHFVNSSAPSKVTGVCAHSEKQSMRGVLFGYTPIPSWCPLPNAKEDANGTA